MNTVVSRCTQYFFKNYGNRICPWQFWHKIIENMSLEGEVLIKIINKDKAIVCKIMNLWMSALVERTWLKVGLTPQHCGARWFYHSFTSSFYWHICLLGNLCVIDYFVIIDNIDMAYPGKVKYYKPIVGC